MAELHDFLTLVRWTGNTGEGNATYRGYQRTWDIAIPGKPIVGCSNDPRLGGDPSMLNPEDIFLSALSSCHMLWYLHLSCLEGIVVTSYEDNAVGHGESERSGAGRFIGATLKPLVHVPKGTDLRIADDIHERIHNVCFIARSVSFPINIEPTYVEV